LSAVHFSHQQSGHIDTRLSNLANVPLVLLRDVWLSQDSTWLLTTSTAAGGIDWHRICKPTSGRLGNMQGPVPCYALQ